MKDLLNNGFQIVSETEMMMVEGGSPDSDRNTVQCPDPGYAHDGGDEKPLPVVPPSGMDLPDPHAGEK